MTDRVPLFAREAALEEIRPRVQQAVTEVIESGAYIGGPDVSAFESEFAEYLGVKHCVGVGNGTDALMIGLLALGVEPGDEVIVPAVSFFATAEAVAAIGATPVFADVEEGTWTISARTVEPKIASRTKALVPVHLFGNPAPMDELLDLARSHGVPVLEDAAQAAGAEYRDRKAGSIGQAAAFSFYPGKNLGAIGDAGALVTNDEEVAAKARCLGDHGSDDRLHHLMVGFNSRLDSIQAAALRIALPKLEEWTLARRNAARGYANELSTYIDLPNETPGAKSCFHLFVISSDRRDRLRKQLESRKIETRIYYSPVLPSQPAMRHLAPDEKYTGAIRYQESCLALPMGESLGAERLKSVVDAVQAGA